MTTQQILMAGGSLPLTLTYRTGTGTSTAQSSLTASTVSIGTASEMRYVVVGVTVGRDLGAAINITGVSVTPNAGSAVNLTQLARKQYTTIHDMCFYGGYVKTGTTADIVASFDANADASSLAVWTIDNLQNTALFDSGNAGGNVSPLTTTMDTNAGGIIMSIASCGSNVVHTWGWSGITQDYDAQFDFIDATYASLKFATAQTNLTVETTVSPTNISGMILSISFRQD